MARRKPEQQAKEEASYKRKIRLNESHEGYGKEHFRVIRLIDTHPDIKDASEIEFEVFRGDEFFRGDKGGPGGLEDFIYEYVKGNFKTRRFTNGGEWWWTMELRLFYRDHRKNNMKPLAVSDDSPAEPYLYLLFGQDGSIRNTRIELPLDREEETRSEHLKAVQKLAESNYGKLRQWVERERIMADAFQAVDEYAEDLIKENKARKAIGKRELKLKFNVTGIAKKYGLTRQAFNEHLDRVGYLRNLCMRRFNQKVSS